MPTTIAAPKTKKTPVVQEEVLPLEGTDHSSFTWATPSRRRIFIKARSVFTAGL